MTDLSGILTRQRTTPIVDARVANSSNKFPLALLGISNRDLLNEFLAAYGKELKYVDMTGFTFAENEDFANFAETSPDVEFLSLEGCDQLTDDTIAIVVEKCRKLKELNLKGCPNISRVVSIPKLLLRRIDLGWPAERIDDVTIENIAKNCPTLHTISLLHCPNVSFDAVQNLARMCPLLREINVDRECPFLSDIHQEQLQAIRPEIVLKRW